MDKKIVNFPGDEPEQDKTGEVIKQLLDKNEKILAAQHKRRRNKVVIIFCCIIVAVVFVCYLTYPFTVRQKRQVQIDSLITNLGLNTAEAVTIIDSQPELKYQKLRNAFDTGLKQYYIPEILNRYNLNFYDNTLSLCPQFKEPMNTDYLTLLRLVNSETKKRTGKERNLWLTDDYFTAIGYLVTLEKSIIHKIETCVKN